jgi:hypothetical protein
MMVVSSKEDGMPWDPDHIDFISEYCDRWCERCSLTHKCAEFTRKDDPVEIESCSEAVEQAMEKLRIELTMPEPPSRPWLDEILSAPPPDEAEQRDRDRAYDEQLRRVRADPIVVASKDYAVESYTWLRLFGEATCARAREALGEDRDVPGALLLQMEVECVLEGVEIVRRDCTLIAAKLRRAVSGKERGAEWFENDPVQTDFNGSAKLALLLAERSEAGWRLLARWAPESAIAIQLANTLAELRVAIERAFPHARRFIRPGFDEIQW